MADDNSLSFSISRILEDYESKKGRKNESNEKAENNDKTCYPCYEIASNVICNNASRLNSAYRDVESNTLQPWQIIPKQTNRRIGHPYQSRAAPKRKKPRTTFSRVQIAELEDLFAEKKYLTSPERLKVANYLNLTDCQVKTWFQNRRTKWKRETEEEKEEHRYALTRTMLNLHRK